ncbi:hypothetical protein COS31_05435 [Candidatus Roizmanbacteria bacterium CG02_land_8_20_14_3_00_36_15]|nr:MAG: hypothetical protein COS31_05435 [Candidatus Roizmanbacteria bacterium CG02_land_8_20_14_3_00_36_15]
MTCPNCGRPMNYVNLELQSIFHCSHCGASFFEENGINRISYTSAEKLAADRKTDEISGAEKLCPHDHLALHPLEKLEAVPETVILLTCDRCHGIFIYPDDLLALKKAQAAKIEFFKAWTKPLPSLKTVLVISLTVFVLGTAVFQSSHFFNNFSSQTQASDLIKKVYFSKSSRYLLVFFQTKTVFRSQIIFFDKTANLKIEKTVSGQPSKDHQLTTAEFNLDHELWYQIILINNEGEGKKTEMKKLILK